MLARRVCSLLRIVYLQLYVSDQRSRRASPEVLNCRLMIFQTKAAGNRTSTQRSVKTMLSVFCLGHMISLGPTLANTQTQPPS